MRIAVKYCGNCNPEINGPRIIGQWMKTLKDDEITFHPEGETPADLLIIICGCRKACGDRPEVRAMGSRVILIKGRRIEGPPLGEAEVIHRLFRSFESIRGKTKH